MIRRFRLVPVALAAMLAGALIAGCSGGSKSSMPAVTRPQLSNKTVGVTMTVIIGGSSSQSTARSPKFVPSGTQSLVIKYQGDNPNSTPVPGGATPPSTAPTAATVNVTQTSTVPPPVGQCAPLGSGLQCTISVSIPVGVVDIYILAYSGTNGTGTLLASSVTTVQVNANGSMTVPGSSTPATINTLTPNFGVAGATFAFTNATFGVTPGLVLPGPSATPTSIPAASFAAGQQTAGNPFSYSAAQGFTLKTSNGVPVAPNTPISITITDNDSTGNTCLVYYSASNATSATPCPFTAAGRTATLVNSSDTYAVMYNNKFVPGAGFTITGTLAGSSATPAPQVVTITPTAVTESTPGFCCTTGSILWDPTSSNIFAVVSEANKPLVAMPYAAASGYGKQSQVSVVTVNAHAAGALQHTPSMMVMGVEKNPWMIEPNPGSSLVHNVAVYVLNATETEPSGGTRVSPSTGAFVEYTLISSGVDCYDSCRSRLASIGMYGGFIWVGDNVGDLWRIDPSTGTVYPNLGTPYTLSAQANPASPVTLANGNPLPVSSTMTFRTNIVGTGGFLYVGDDHNNTLWKLTPDLTINPSNACVMTSTKSCIATGAVGGSFVDYPTSLYFDGLNLYAQDDEFLAEFTLPGLVHSSALAQFTVSGDGGLAQGADGWFWSSGQDNSSPYPPATYVPSMTAPSGTGGQANLDLAGQCYNEGTYYNTGQGFVLGPDNTLIMAVTDGLTDFCGIVY